jgi:excisionase family DNA binding protein
MQIQTKHLITVREQANLLSVSPRHLHDLTRQRIIPCVRLGRSVRYSPQAVAAALEKNATQRALA